MTYYKPWPGFANKTLVVAFQCGMYLYPVSI